MADVVLSNNDANPDGDAREGQAPAPLDNQLLVTTPENIAFQYRMAGPFQRLGAYLLDILISQCVYGLLAFLVLLLFTVVLIPTSGGAGGGSLAETVLGMLQGMALIGMFLMTWFYGAVTETLWNGQSPGKKFFRLRVLSTDGSAINGAQATLRNFFRLLDIMPMVSLGFLMGQESLNNVMVPTALFGLIAMTITRGFRRIGDCVAGTMVICETREATHGIVEFRDPRVATLAALLPVDFEISTSLAQTLAEYVDQRRHLAPERVAEIAAHLAVPLLQRFGLPSDTNHDLLLCALYYRAFVDLQPADADPPFAVHGDASTNAWPSPGQASAILSGEGVRS